MYAIVDIAGQQFKVEKNQKVFVHRINAEEGSSVDFDEVLLVDNDGKVQVGTPTVANTFVSAKVVNHLKADKVKVFHKKRRKGYEKLNGHRQYMTEIVIEDIKEGKATNKIASKSTAAPKTKTTAKKEATAPKKVAAPKAEETKKAAAPKAETAEKPKAKAAPKAAPKAKAAPKKETAEPKKKAAPKAAAKPKTAAKAAPKAKAEKKDTKEDKAE
jgi:large subunit ribosomal protein L21